jgi:hypothetical protein
MSKNTGTFYISYPATNYIGQGDITSKDITADNESVMDCLKFCDTFPECTGFVSNEKKCWFKNANVKVPTYDTAYRYHFKPTMSPTPLPALPSTPTSFKNSEPYKIYPATNYVNQGDITSRSGNINDCQLTCSILPECSGFVTDGKTCQFKNTNVKLPEYDPKSTYYFKSNTMPAPQGPAIAISTSTKLSKQKQVCTCDSLQGLCNPNALKIMFSGIFLFFLLLITIVGVYLSWRK